MQTSLSRHEHTPYSSRKNATPSSTPKSSPFAFHFFFSSSSLFPFPFSCSDQMGRAFHDYFSISLGFFFCEPFFFPFIFSDLSVLFEASNPIHPVPGNGERDARHAQVLFGVFFKTFASFSPVRCACGLCSNAIREVIASKGCTLGGMIADWHGRTQASYQFIIFTPAFTCRTLTCTPQWFTVVRFVGCLRCRSPAGLGRIVHGIDRKFVSLSFLCF